MDHTSINTITIYLHLRRMNLFTKEKIEEKDEIAKKIENMSYEGAMKIAKATLKVRNEKRIKEGLKPFETVDEMYFGVKTIEVKMRDVSPEERQALLKKYGKDNK